MGETLLQSPVLWVILELGPLAAFAGGLIWPTHWRRVWIASMLPLAAVVVSGAVWLIGVMAELSEPAKGPGNATAAGFAVFGLILVGPFVVGTFVGLHALGAKGGAWWRRPRGRGRRTGSLSGRGENGHPTAGVVA